LKDDLVIDLNKWDLKGLELLPTTLDTLSSELVHLSSSSSDDVCFKKKLNDTRQGLQMGNGWDACFGYIVHST
jgi:hypothetical protein